MNVQIQPGYAVAQNQDEVPQPPDNSAELAHATVASARELLKQAEQSLRETAQAAATAGHVALEAEASLAEKERKLQQQGEQWSPVERETFEAEVASERDRAWMLRQEANRASNNVQKSEQDVHTCETKLLDVESTANRVLKELGLGTPYKSLRKDRDSFEDGERSGKDVLCNRDAAKLFAAERQRNFIQAAACDASRVSVSAETKAPNGAVILGEQIINNTDPGYRAELVAAVQAPLGQMAAALADELRSPRPEDEEGLTPHDGLSSLIRASEALGGQAACPLAEAFAQGIKEGDQAGAQALAKALGEVMAERPQGGTFAVLLAAVLQSENKPESAHVVLCAICEAIDAVRARFERAVDTGRKLDRRLAGLARRLGPRMTAAEMEEIIKRFRFKHASAYAQRERAAADLGALLDGAGMVLQLAGPEPLLKGEAASSLMDRSLLALGWAEEILQTDAGQKLLGNTVDAQRRGQRTFLDALPVAAQVLGEGGGEGGELLARVGLDPALFADGGARFLRNVGESMARWLAPQLLALCSSGHEVAALALLATTINRNQAVFGLDRRRAGAIHETASAVVHARSYPELRQALTAFGKMAREDQPEAGDPLRALALVMGVPTFLLNVSQSRAEGLAHGLRDAAAELVQGVGGISVLGAMLGNARPGPAIAQLLGTSGHGLSPQVLSAKLQEALRAVTVGVGQQLRRTGWSQWPVPVVVAEVTASLANVPAEALSGAMIITEAAAVTAAGPRRESVVPGAPPADADRVAA